MLLNNEKSIRTIQYSPINETLTVIYTDGGVRVYSNVKPEVYESIRNSGNVVPDSILESLQGGYQEMV